VSRKYPEKRQGVIPRESATEESLTFIRLFVGAGIPRCARNDSREISRMTLFQGETYFPNATPGAKEDACGKSQASAARVMRREPSLKAKSERAERRAYQ
jgi:hypothetical protein